MLESTQSRKPVAPAKHPAGKRVAPPGESRDQYLAAGIDIALANCWTGHKRAFKHCRRKPGPKAVHDLRVHIRRVQSVLLLLRPLLPAKRVDRLLDALKGQRKALSDLRDAQVLLDLTNTALPDSPYTRAFTAHWRCRQNRLIGRITGELGKSVYRKLNRRWMRMVKDLADELASPGSAPRAERAITSALERAFARLRARLRQVDATSTATIHRTRVAFKAFRYMLEALSGIRPGIDAKRLRAMHTQQDRMGDIQDIDILLNRVEKFLQRAAAPAATITRFQRTLLARRDSLVARFLSSADELLSMWPVPVSKGSQHRIRYRVPQSTATPPPRQ